ncbi:MAG TPA: type III PLP-dependent enzyme [Methylomirabilota bacterium]
MDRVVELVSRYFPGSDSELRVGGVPVGDLAARYGTPLYVYDARILDRKWDLLRGALPPEFSIAYSVKANPNPVIVRHFLDKGAGLEIASAGELLLALDAGARPESVLFAGPGKTEAELELALERRIGEIHVESAREAGRIAAIAARLGVRARAALRVNPAAEAQGGAMRMGGKPAPFGVDEESLDEVLDVLSSQPAIEVCGLHLFAGTQILDYSVLARQYRRGVDIARRAARRLGRPLRTLDFGGGLGIPYFANETELDMDKLREEVRGLMASIEGDPLFAGTRFLVEPGRYLVGEAGVYVTRVNDIKVSRGKTFYIVDGGMNHHLAASGNLGQVIKRNFPIAVLNRLHDRADQPADVVGPLCTPLDTLAREAALPRAEVGDLVGIFQSGAYGLTASPTAFLGHPQPPEVLVAPGGPRLIRPRIAPYGGAS